MKFFLVVVPLLFALPASGQHNIQDPTCKGVIHGVVLGHDRQPVKGINVVLYPLGVGLGFVLPHAKTDQQGEYRFEQVCSGRFSVFVKDNEAGYSQSSPYMYQFLYGRLSPEVKITDTILDAPLAVDLPSKPAQLQLRLINSRTKEKIMTADIEAKVSRNRSVKVHSEASILADTELVFLLPPDQDVFLHITSKGFHAWKESVGRGKLFRVPSGELLTIQVELDPIQN
jgi:hypothetical protein